MVKYLVIVDDFHLDVRIYPDGRAIFNSPVLKWERTFADEEQAFAHVDDAFASVLKAEGARMVHRVVYANVREMCQQASNPDYWSGPERDWEEYDGDQGNEGID